MVDSDRRQAGILAYFKADPNKPSSNQTFATAKKTESVKSEDRTTAAKPVKAPAAKPKKRTPAKSRATIANSKKGTAVVKQKSKTPKPPAKKKKPVKKGRRRRRDEEEEYDSDFVTSDDSVEISDEEEVEAKPKGPKRIVCSDGESDAEIEPAAQDDDKTVDNKQLVNQTITNFVSPISEQQKSAPMKSSRPSAALKPAVSSTDFFGASSKPKMIIASRNPPSQVLLHDIPKDDDCDVFLEPDPLDDEMMFDSVHALELPTKAEAPIIDSLHAPESSETPVNAEAAIIDPVDDSKSLKSPTKFESPSTSLKENIAPSEPSQDCDDPMKTEIMLNEEVPEASELVDTESKTLDNPAPSPPVVTANPGKKWYPGQQRAAPKLQGLKPIPKGEPNCLAGKRFVITGVLESLERDACSDLIKSLGGAVTGAVSGKTTHLVVGDEPSEKKLGEARQRKIEIIDEDGLFRLISSSASVPMAKMATVELKIPSSNHSLSTTMGTSPSPMWVDKYKPASSADLCANPGVIDKLRKFLKNWPNTEERKHAVLLSGPPGIGKSSAAAICCKEAGYNVVELNASTTRSKKALAQHVKELLQCHSISEYYDGHTKPKQKKDFHKTVLIMDEVDGMSGGDRGGMQELYSFIKSTKVPIICICNDRASPKVKTLANYCIDLRFRRPMATQVAARLGSIAKAEGLNVDMNVLTKLVETTRGDIRQMLNIMQLWRTSSSTITFEDAKGAATKDFENSPFDLAPELFRPVSPHQTDWVSSRMDVYFSDPSLIPLMVQGNYLNCIPQLPASTASQTEDRRQLCYLERFAKAANFISDGDLIESQIRGGQSWSLMPINSVISAVAPGFQIAGHLQGRIEFPQWLGKNATFGKNTRLLAEVHSHVMNKMLGVSVRDLGLDYLPVLRRRIVNALTERGSDAIDEIVSLTNRYNLTRLDLDIIFELFEPISGKVALNTKVKTALTRALTQHSTAVVSSRSKARAAALDSNPLPVDDEILDDALENVEEDDQEDQEKPDISSIPALKAVKTKTASGSKRKSTGKSESKPAAGKRKSTATPASSSSISKKSRRK